MSDHNDQTDNSTGHEWDGIRELKNPPPRWWAWGFYAGLTFVTAYYIIYPSTPLNNKIQEVVNGERVWKYWLTVTPKVLWQWLVPIHTTMVKSGHSLKLML